MIRFFEVSGRLQQDVGTCLKTGQFLLAFRPFRRGPGDCQCVIEVESCSPRPSPAAWRTTWDSLETVEGLKQVCRVCGACDHGGVHDPDAM